MLTVFFAISQARQVALQKAGQPVPQAFQAMALIDTGASCTNIDPVIVTALNLQATGSASVVTPSTGPTPHQTDQYDVGVVIPGPQANSIPFILRTVPVIAMPLFQAQGFHALIGRDILSHCVLTYNGGAGGLGFFTLAY